MLLGLLLQATLLDQGQAAFERGDLEQARLLLARAAKEQPSARAWKALGSVLAAGQEMEAAEPAFAESCRLDPKEPDACYYWARALYTLNRFAPALSALERIQGPQPRAWRIPLARAQALEALGRAGEAEPLFQDAIRKRKADRAAPGLIDPLIAYALYLYRQGRPEDSLKLLEGQGAAYAGTAGWHYHRGRALMQTSRLEDAIAALGRAVALQPDYGEAHAALSRAYYRAGRPELGARHAALSSQGSRTVK